ncbi:MAG: FtsX-like permease family protein [bacterium]|nr:FtsX-like permease family protein [bacterium]
MLFSKAEKHPPRIARWIFARMSDYIYLGSLGDLEEDFRKLLYAKGIIQAYTWYWVQIIAALPGYIKQYIYWRYHMFKNYLKVSLRIIKRHKGFSFINISGLAIGMACCILILLWVQDELSYDRFHKNADNLYRAVWEMDLGDRTRFTGSCPAPLAAALKEIYPEVLKASMVTSGGGTSFRVDDETYRESRLYFADPDFFEMFSFEFISGNPLSALNDPYSIVITEEIAEKYFKNEDPLGKILNMNNKRDLTVTGVVKNVPENSSIRFKLISPFKLLYEISTVADVWDRHSYRSYVLLTEGISVESFNEKISDFKEEYSPDTQMKLLLHPVKNIHLHSNFIGDGFGNKGNIKYIYIFSTLAALILLIACINFMNLMTARSSKRAKEVGMRKVAGACRADIISQFFSETLFLSFIALAVSIILVKLTLPGFNDLARKNLDFNVLNNIYLVVGLFIITMITGIISASYPSLYISSFQPVKIIKGMLNTGPGRFNLRNFLVVSQLSLSVMLIIGAIALSKQVNYIQTKDLGWDRDHLISIAMSTKDVRSKVDVLKAEFLHIPDVINVGGSRSPAAWKETRINGLEWEGQTEEQSVEFWVDRIDPGYIETLGIEIVSGRNFSKEFTSDIGKAYLINEEAVKQMGLSDPVGKGFTLDQEGTIVGVMKDHIFESFHSPVAPLLLSYEPSKLYYIHVKLKPENIQESLSTVEETWKRINPGVPFSYDFVDDDFDFLFRTEKRIGTIFRWSAILGIFISCLGLIGLASYIAQQRTKEFGIRKVLGGAETGLIFLMLKEFLKWVLIANIIAWPVSWYVVGMFMQNYAFKTEVGWEIYALSGFIALTSALITVSYQAIKASRTNPVDLLRYE